MRAISSILFIGGSILITFLFGNSIISPSKIISYDVDSTRFVIAEQIDSLNLVRINLNENTNNRLQNNTEILQDKKEELIQLDLCLDKLRNKNHNTNTNISVCDTITKNL